MTSHAGSAAGGAAGAFVTWLTHAALSTAVAPAVVALPVNLAADKLAGAAVRWFKRFKKTDDLSRLLKTAAGTSVDLSNDEFKALRKLLEDEETWRLLAGDELKVQELTSKIAACLPARDGRTAEDSLEAAGTIARGLMGFAVLDLEQGVFQRVVLVHLHQARARDDALSGMLKDLYGLADDRLPPGPAGPGEIKIYLQTLIDWLNTDTWPTGQQFRKGLLTPATVECKLRVSATDSEREQDADADDLARQCTRLVILGEPGSGKTWLAKRTARICAEKALKALDDDVALDEVGLPLYTTCSDLFNKKDGGDPHGRRIQCARRRGRLRQLADQGRSAPVLHRRGKGRADPAGSRLPGRSPQ